MNVCDSGDLLPVEEAIEQLLAQAPPPPSTEVIALAQALGRVVADEVFSPLDLPSWDNSAMDGYALRAFDVPEQGASCPPSRRPCPRRPSRPCRRRMRESRKGSGAPALPRW